jgi:hypothetical protein
MKPAVEPAPTLSGMVAFSLLVGCVERTDPQAGQGIGAFHAPHEGRKVRPSLPSFSPNEPKAGLPEWPQGGFPERAVMPPLGAPKDQEKPSVDAEPPRPPGDFQSNRTTARRAPRTNLAGPVHRFPRTNRSLGMAFGLRMRLQRRDRRNSLYFSNMLINLDYHERTQQAWGLVSPNECFMPLGRGTRPHEKDACIQAARESGRMGACIPVETERTRTKAIESTLFSEQPSVKWGKLAVLTVSPNEPRLAPNGRGPDPRTNRSPRSSRSGSCDDRLVSSRSLRQRRGASDGWAGGRRGRSPSSGYLGWLLGPERPKRRGRRRLQGRSRRQPRGGEGRGRPGRDRPGSAQ